MVENTNSKMLSDLNEELESAREYVELAQDISDEAESECLLAIAKDEYQHAQFLAEVLDENGYKIPDATVTDMQEVKAMLGKFHRHAIITS